MAQLNFQSAGVSTREIDLTGPTSIQPVGIPAGIISPTQQGPAFVPMIQPTDRDYRVRFGDPVTNLKYGPLSAIEWLRTQQSLVQLRVLGAGDCTQRLSAGNTNSGKVTSAGFVVGDRQPQTLLTGALSNNTFANAGGVLGRTFFLGCFMSESAGSTFLSDAGLGAVARPIVRGVIFGASGVIATLSASNTNSTIPTAAQIGNFNGGTVYGAWTGSMNLNSSKQEFVMLLNGHKGTDPQYPNYMTMSFDANAPNYFASVMNKDPLKLEDAGYVLYTFYDVTTAQAVPTGSGVVINSSGSGARSGYENIAFIVTGSLSRNSGSTTAPNFECFEDRYQTPSTPWIMSQKFGGRAINLFKVWNLSDGDVANAKLKVSIENIAPSNSDVSPYGTFDLIVRDFNDTDANRVILEQWRGLSLDPSSPRYIARIVGDNRTYFNFDAATTAQKLITDGDFENKSRYIRVEMADIVKTGEIDGTALPMGFRGHQHLMTSGSAPLINISDTNYFTKSSVLYDTVQPPTPMRVSIAKGTGTSKTFDRGLYWGVQFEQVTSSTDPNVGTSPNKSMPSLTKYFPNFQLEWQDFAVNNNEGTADTAANGIIDADRFNNNAFTLENVKITYNTTTLAADVTTAKNWTYVRGGGISTDSTAGTRALTVSDLLDPSVRSLAKFTLHMEGGFDGVRIFNSDTKYLTNNAVYQELTNQTRGFSSGPTVSSYIKAIDIMKDTTEVDIQLLTIPGIRHRYITDTAILAVENNRFDCFYIFDIEERDTLNAVVTDSATQNISVKFTAADFRGRGLNSSFAGAYFPDVVIRDTVNNVSERVPPSVAVLGAFGKNDAVGHPWFAPAGFTRGSLPTVQEASVLLSRQNMDDLYSVNINPIVAFAGQGPTIWGQKTVYASQSALDRVNVRRLLLSIRRDVKRVANRIMFQPLRADTIANFNRLVTPILKRAQDQGGVDSFSVNIDTSTTTQADIENKTIRGKIYLVPTRTLEFLDLNFVITNQGATVA